MFHFTEKTDKPLYNEFSDTSAYKDIKPKEETSFDKVQSFWENVYDGEDTFEADVFGEEDSLEAFWVIEEGLFSDIFECSEDDFEFDFDVSDVAVQAVLGEFGKSHWDEFSESEKLNVVEAFIGVLSEKLGIVEKPVLRLYEAEENSCGAFNQQTNTLLLNRSILENSKEVVNTIAHELRHAYQHQRAELNETWRDALYKINFNYYLEPIQIDGVYVGFTDYQNQLVEAEARAFEKLFRI